MATFAGAYPAKSSWQLQLDASEGALEAVNNRSFVNWGLYIYRGNADTPFNNAGSGYSVGGPGAVSGTFGAFRFGGSGTGTNYSGTPVGGRVLIASGGDWVTHDPDGSGSVAVSASHAAAATLGTASLSGTLTLTTLTQPPGVPTALAFAYVSDSQTSLGWMNNAASNGQPVSNQVQASVNGAAFSQVASIATATSVALASIANRKTVAQVRATNAAGSSAWSVSSNAVYTSPAAPSGVTATKDTALDIAVAWTPNVAFSEHQHVVEHGTVLAGVTTWDGSPLATVTAGTSAFTHTAPDPAQVHVYRVSAKNIDTAALQSATVLSNTVQLLAAPNKPTIPTLPAYTDKGKTFVLPWVHNPVDSTGQTFYEVQSSTNGGSSWTSTGKITSTTSAKTFAANAYAANDALTVRVRTWGQSTSGADAGASPWSDPQTVTFKTRPVATIITPTDGGTWTQADLTVALGFSQAESATFVNATIALINAGTTLETLVSTILASTSLVTEVNNGGTYTVTVTVLDSNGLVSDPVSSTFTVAYTLPVPAGITITYLPDSGIAQLDLTIPTAGVGEEEAVAVTIFRTIDGVRETIITAYPTAPTLTILDMTPTISGTNTYRVRTISADDAVADAVQNLVTAEGSRAFLSTGAGYSMIITFQSNLRVASNPARAQTLVQTAGRVSPIALFGETQTLEVSGSATITLDDLSTAQEIEEFIRVAGIVCYRDPTGRRMFGTVAGSVDTPSIFEQEFKFTVVEAS